MFSGHPSIMIANCLFCNARLLGLHHQGHLQVLIILDHVSLDQWSVVVTSFVGCPYNNFIMKIFKLSTSAQDSLNNISTKNGTT